MSSLGKAEKSDSGWKSNRNFPPTPRSYQDISPSHFPAKNPYCFLSPHRAYAHPACLSILDLITLITFGEEYRSVCRVRGTVTSSVWSPKSLFSTVFTIVGLPLYKYHWKCCTPWHSTQNSPSCSLLSKYHTRVSVITLWAPSKACCQCADDQWTHGYSTHFCTEIYPNRTKNTDSWAWFY
jgi:hypothetical protein